MSKKSKSTVAEQASAQLETTESFTINEVLAMTGLSNVYVRKCIAKGTLKVTKGFIPGTKTPRNSISRVDFDAWRATIGTGTRRADGRNKYVLYLSPEETEKLMTLIAGEPFAELLQRANIKAEAEIEPTEA
jgi:hypothetical protein